MHRIALVCLAIALAATLAAAQQSAPAQTQPELPNPPVEATGPMTQDRWNEPCQPSIDTLQLVTDQAVLDNGNAWGGHQSRVVRNKFGVFTAYTSSADHASMFPRQWHLMQQTPGGWAEIAHAPSGKEPVNLLTGPAGQIYIVSWPFKAPVLWEAVPDKQGKLVFTNGRLNMMDWPVPGNWSFWHWPYNSTAINEHGQLFVLQNTTEHTPAEFRMSLYDPARKVHRTVRMFSIPMTLRHCYTWIFPRGSELWMASIQDIRIQDLGKEPTKELEKFPYMFNAVTVWHSDDYMTSDPAAIFYRESHYDEQVNPRADLRIQDAYLDTHDHLHVLYHYRSQQTNHSGQVWHMILDRDGKELYNARRPDMRSYCRMLQDTQGRHYILSDRKGGGAQLAAAIDALGSRYTDFVPLDTGPYKVTYSNYAWSDPRCGVPLSDSVDVVFPAGQGEQWVYFRLHLRPGGDGNQE